MPNPRGRPPNPPDPLQQMLTDAAKQDEVIKLAVRKLAFEVVYEAHNLLSSGSPATRLSVIRSLLPALVRSLEKTDQEDSTATLQKELASLMDEIRTGAKVVLEVQPVAPTEDTPYPHKLNP